MNHQFKAPVTIWLSKYSHHDADSLQTANTINGLTVWEEDFEPSENYTRVGFGEVTVTIASKDEIIAGKVESLRAELEEDRARSQIRQNALIKKINEMLAITNEVPA